MSQSASSSVVPWWLVVLGVLFAATVLTLAVMVALWYLFLGILLLPFILYFVYRIRRAGSRSDTRTD